jgi:hypothetical protein
MVGVWRSPGGTAEGIYASRDQKLEEAADNDRRDSKVTMIASEG